MTGREFYAYLEAHGALDLPLIFHGYIDLGDGDADNEESPLEDCDVDVTATEVRLYCV